jgi:hypothetical protein
MMSNQLWQTTVVCVALAGAMPHVAAAQDSPEALIVRRAMAASRQAYPDWAFVPAIMSAPPLIAEQLGVAGGIWDRASDPSTLVSVTVYTIASPEAAASWIYRQAHGEVSKGWTVVQYEAGDGANLSTYPDPRGFTQYAIAMRKGRFLLMASGRSKQIVDRFAQILLAAASEEPGR